MDELRATLATFSEDDRREFQAFLQRHRKRSNRKDQELTQLLLQAKPLSTPEMLKRLYPAEPNPTAYYALRKRLLRHITSFILLRQFENDSTAAAPVMGLLALARYLFDAGLEKLAWQYLKKAEKMAAENEQFDLLNSVYNLQLEHTESDFAPDLNELIEKRNANKAAADEEERANIANSLINRQLQQIRSQGRDLEFDAVIKNTLEQCGVTQAVSNRPSLLYKLMSITRSAVLVRKDFFDFEPYIIGQYEQMAAQRGFSAVHRNSQLGLLYMIAHVLYRNRKFARAEHYLQQMELLLKNASQAQLLHFFPRHKFLLGACYAFQNKLPQAIADLEETLEKYQALLTPRNLVTAYLQLSFYYFTQQDFVRSWRLLQSLPFSDTWCEKKMGREWLLKKKVGEVILQVEMQNPDLAHPRLQAVERDFKDLLQQPLYENERAFLKLLHQLIEQPALVTSPDFFRKVQRAISFAPLEQEDLPSISFYAWLKSKMVQSNYYQQLREFTQVPDPA